MTKMKYCLIIARLVKGVVLSKFLRNFGEFIKSIQIYSHNKYEKENHFIYKSYILDLISLYCSGGSLIKLKLNRCDLTAVSESSQRSLFLHLLKFSVEDCVLSKSFAQALPSMAPALRELELIKSWCKIKMPIEDILRMPFPKLKMISYARLLNVKHNEVDDFLKLNP